MESHARGAAFQGMAMESKPFFYLLTEDNLTATLAYNEPPWGRRLTGVPEAGVFEMTPWQGLQHVLVHGLARHHARVLSPLQASLCVVASPAERSAGSDCSGAHARVAGRLAALGQRICPDRPIAVIDGPDADGSKDALCNSLWSPASCRDGARDVLVRVSGNAPGLQSEVATGQQRGLCRRVVPTPYLAHARSAAAAAWPAASAGTSAPRPLRIAYAAASWGHVDAEHHGFVAWRKALRNACKTLYAQNSTTCQWVWISMSGQGAEQAIRQYARSDFCLQPPGDTLPRPGIIDALTTGCIPVLFHPGQATLWPEHFHAHRGTPPSAVLIDWTNGAPRPRARDREHTQYAPSPCPTSPDHA